MITAGGDEEPVGRGGAHGRQLVDFGTVGAVMRPAAAVLALGALAGVVWEGLTEGLTFGVLARWGGLLVAGLLVVAAVATALSALRGMGRAQRRGERLAGRDVRLTPPRRERPPPP